MLFRSGLRMTATKKDDTKRVEFMNQTHKTMSDISKQSKEMARPNVVCKSENCKTEMQTALHARVQNNAVDIPSGYAGQADVSPLELSMSERINGDKLSTLRWWSDKW